MQQLQLSVQRLQVSVSAEDQDVAVSWQVGSECAAYVGKEKCYHRAIISEINGDEYKVTVLV